MGYQRVVSRGEPLRSKRYMRPFLSNGRRFRIPAFNVGAVTPQQVEKWITIGARRRARHARMIEQQLTREKEAIRRRALELWKVHGPRIAAARTPDAYRIAYTRYRDFVFSIFGKKSASPVLRELAEEGLIRSRAKQGHFHTGYFARQEDAINFVNRNRGAVINFLKEKYNIPNVAAATLIINEILPNIVEGLMRFDSSKKASPLTHMLWWVRSGMTARMKLQKKRALSLDQELDGNSRGKPIRLRDEIASPLVGGELSSSQQAAHLAAVMNQLDQRYAQIFALSLQGYTNAQIAAVMPSPRHKKSGQPVGESAIRMAMRKIIATTRRIEKN